MIDLPSSIWIKISTYIFCSKRSDIDVNKIPNWLAVSITPCYKIRYKQGLRSLDECRYCGYLPRIEAIKKLLFCQSKNWKISSIHFKSLEAQKLASIYMVGNWSSCCNGKGLNKNNEELGDYMKYS